MGGKGGRIISSRVAGVVCRGELSSIYHVLTDETGIATREGVNISHHASRAMDHCKIVAVDLTVVIQNLFIALQLQIQ